MFLRALPLLAALLASPAVAKSPAPDPAVNGLRWTFQTPGQFTTFEAIRFQAYLVNGTAKPIQFTNQNIRQALELILTAEGKKPIRKPVPGNALIQKTPNGKLNVGAHAFFVKCDLRRAFGPLAPGRYTIQIVHAARGYWTDVPGFQLEPIPAQPFAFKVVKTSLQDAQKKNDGAKGLELDVETFKNRKVVVFTNNRNRSVTFWAYGPDRKQVPASSLIMAQQWNGTKWQGGIGGFCGTGLRGFLLKPGESRELQLPLYSEGIVRFRMNCAEGEGQGAKQLVATSDAFIARPN